MTSTRSQSAEIDCVLGRIAAARRELCDVKYDAVKLHKAEERATNGAYINADGELRSPLAVVEIDFDYYAKIEALRVSTSTLYNNFFASGVDYSKRDIELLEQEADFINQRLSADNLRLDVVWPNDKRATEHYRMVLAAPGWKGL